MVAHPKGQLALPHRFGRYQLLDLLGEGGFAKVYRAELQGPSGFRKGVAIKLIKEVSTAQISELNHEGRLGGLLKHRNVVDTYELGIHQDTVYLAMELVEGLSLRQVMDTGALPQSVVMEVLYGIARGLSYAHTLRADDGVVHLDLKPENVLIGWDGSVKVSDFGVSRLWGSRGEADAVIVGTPRYMSPEQWTGRDIGCASDVFSLGLLLYELVREEPLLKRRPTGDPSEWSAFTSDFDAAEAALEETLPGLGVFARQCLHIDAAARPASAKELLQPIRALWRQVGDEPPLEDWLSETVGQREKETTSRPSLESIYNSAEETLDVMASETALDAAEAALEASTDEASALAALAQLEQSLAGLSVSERGDWQERGAQLLGRAGFEWVRGGVSPFLVTTPERRTYWLNGETLATFRRQATGGALLYALAVHGDTWDRERLFVEVWKQPYRPPSSDTALRVQIHRLREKLKASGVVIEGLSDGRYVIHGGPAVLVWHGQALEVSASAQPQEVVAEPEVQTNLGPAPNRFCGREEEKAELVARWEEGQRLIGIHGPPSSGKSRFATHVGREALATGRFTSVWMCDLAEVRDEEGLVAALSQALGLPVSADNRDSRQTAQRLGDVLASRGRTLILLDHPERVVDALIPHLEAWWTQAAAACFLVVSQRPMSMAQMVRLMINPLSLPSGTLSVEEGRAHAAVALFVERARAVQPEFALTTASLEAICGIIRKVDGLPLAIELAASRVSMMTPLAIQQRLSERFRLLTGGKDSLRASLDWSWGLLDDVEQRAMAQLSVFRGGCSWEAAEAVVSLDGSDVWSVDVIGRLVEHSLVRVSEVAGESRLSMLSVVSAYASQRLEEMPELKRTAIRSHGAYFAQMGESAELRAGRIMGGAANVAVARLDLENLVAAVDGSLADHRSEEGVLACLAALNIIRQVGPLGRGLRLAMRVLAACDEADPNRGRLSLNLAKLQLRVGRLDQGYAVLETLLASEDETGVLARLWLAGQRQEEGSPDEAKALFDSAWALAQGLGESRLTSLVQMRLGNWYRLHGQIDDALAALNQAVTLANAIGDQELRIDAHRFLGIAHWSRGAMDQAGELYEEALEWSQTLGRRQSEASLLGSLGVVYARQKKFELAERSYERAIGIYKDLGDRLQQQTVILNMGVLMEGLDRLDDARRLYEHALGLAQGGKSVRNQGVLLGNLAVLHARSGEFTQAREVFNEALALHRGVGNRLDEGKVLGNLGYLNRDEGNLKRARERFQEALDIAIQLKDVQRQTQLRGAIDALND